jgi:hypothetical protein
MQLVVLGVFVAILMLLVIKQRKPRSIIEESEPAPEASAAPSPSPAASPSAPPRASGKPATQRPPRLGASGPTGR